MPNTESSSPNTLPATGWIDLHSHLLPDVDDGCENLEESIECINTLRQAGYIGSICTPHMAVPELPGITPAHVRGWVAQLSNALAQQQIPYRIWTGGELRLSKEVIPWMEKHGVPTLAHSRCVLVDMWDGNFPTWVEKSLRWLLDHNYQPILAHPERLHSDDLDAHLRHLEAMGVWLQGNFRCLTGEEGPMADRTVRKLIGEKRYRFMALDMHRPNSLEGRLDGIPLLTQEFGQPLLDQFLTIAPRRDILSI